MLFLVCGLGVLLCAWIEGGADGSAEGTPNNGSFEWRSDDDTYLYGKYSKAPTSGCNYTMEFRIDGLVVDSEFFTLLNAEDGGLTPDMTVICKAAALPGGMLSNIFACGTFLTRPFRFQFRARSGKSNERHLPTEQSWGFKRDVGCRCGRDGSRAYCTVCRVHVPG
jgi:hypothetical protein